MATIVAHHDHCAIVERGPSVEQVVQAADGNGGQMEMTIGYGHPLRLQGYLPGGPTHSGLRRAAMGRPGSVRDGLSVMRPRCQGIKRAETDMEPDKE